MFAGYLLKRNVPISPPSMQKVYSVLAGTMLLDFDSEEDAKVNINPKLICEVLGISEWDGVGRVNQYSHGFIVVTHTGETYYLNALSAPERDEWILHVKRALECNFANPEVVAYKPSKLIHERPHTHGNTNCPVTKSPLNTAATYYCKGCGRGYSSSEYIHEPCTMLQLGLEVCERVCVDCKNAQACIYWLKLMNYTHVMTIHEYTSSVVTDINRFKCSFKLRRRLSQRLDMAAILLEKENISPDEFEELRRVDFEYRREQNYQEARTLGEALDAIGEDMQYMISLLLSPIASDRGGRVSFSKLLMKILEIADHHAELIDFYWPQLIQVHLLLNVHHMDILSLTKIDLLQQALLAIALKYPPLGLKLAWALCAVSADYAEKRVTQIQYAACTCLLLQLEMLTTGFISSIADVPSCKLLHRILHAAGHQQAEIGYEIGILLLSRRQLQETCDRDEEERRRRNIDKGILYGGRSNPSSPSSAADRNEETEAAREPWEDDDTSCRYIFKHMGVGTSSSTVTQDGRDKIDDLSDDTGSESKENRKSVGGHRSHADLFIEQLDFVEQLTDLADSLRFIDRPIRTEMLKKSLTKLQAASPSIPAFGWDPTVNAGEPCYRIRRILIDECRVFRTKARAPSLIVCEVVRDDTNSNLHRSISDMNFLSPLDQQQQLQQQQDSDNTNHGNHIIESAKSAVPKPLQPPQTSSAEGGLVVPMTARATKSVVVNIEEVDGLLESGISQAIADIKDNISASPEKAKLSLTEEKELMETAGLGKPLSLSKGLSPLRSSDNLQGLAAGKPMAGNTVQGPLPKRSFISTHRKSMTFLSSLESLAGGSGSSSGNSGGGGVLSSQGSNSINNNSNSSSSSSSNSINNHIPSQGGSLFSDEAGARNSFDSSHDGSSIDASNDRLQTGVTDSMNPDLMDIVEVPLFPTTTTAAAAAELTHAIQQQQQQSSLFLSETESLQSPPLPPIQTAFVKKKVYLSAQSLLSAGKIAESEFNMLILSDSRFRDLSAKDEAIFTMLKVENAFGESWDSKRLRVLGDKAFLTSWTQSVRNDGCSLDDQVSNMRIGLDISDALSDTLTSVDQAGGGTVPVPALVPGIESVSEKSMAALQEQPLFPQWPLYDLRAFIVKSNDDLRQEVCCLQIMSLCKEIFNNLGLDRYLWLNPYRIISTGSSTGIVQVLPNSMSIDALKKTPGFINLPTYFKTTYGASPELLIQAKKNFASSLAAYSLFCYILAIKDRHNGNILIDTDGHLVHIDFGFILSIAPGGAFSLESAPFKLTEEMVEVLEGIESSLFGYFVKSFTLGFLALRSHAEIIISDIQLLSHQSPFPCFNGKDVAVIMEKLRGRFRTDLSVKDFVKHCMDLIVSSYGAYGTKQYDSFQWYTNGITP